LKQVLRLFFLSARTQVAPRTHLNDGEPEFNNSRPSSCPLRIADEPKCGKRTCAQGG